MSFLVLVFILFCCWLILALSKGDICELLHFHNFFTFKGDTCEAFSQKQCFHFLDHFWNVWTQLLQSVWLAQTSLQLLLLLKQAIAAAAAPSQAEFWNEWSNRI